MRVLVTGGLGYIGSRLSKLLIDRGCSVTILDNFLSQPDARLLHNIWQAKIQRGDVRNAEDVKRAVYGQDIIVHLASIVGAPACDIDPGFAQDVNINGTFNVLNAMSPAQRIIFTSTTSSYGNQPNRVVNEASELRPLTSYGYHKAAGEELVKQMNRYIIFRPATAFGSTYQERVDLLPNTLSYRAIKDKYIDVFEPWSVRTFIHADDFAHALVYAIYDGMLWNEIYNIGDPKLTMTKEELSREIALLAGAEIEVVQGEDPDKRDYDVSFAKMWSTGFRPLRRLEDGFYDIRNNFEFIRANYEKCSTPYKVQEFLKNERI